MKKVALKSISLLLFSIALGWLLYACKIKNTPDNIYVSNWQPNLTLPLVRSDLNLKNIVQKQKANLTIEEDADGYYTFIYYSNYDSITVSSLNAFKFEDQSFSLFSYNLPIPARSPGQTFTTTQPGSFTLSTPEADQRIDNIVFKSGTFQIPVNSSYRHNIAIRLTMPDLTKNGQGFDQTVVLPAGGVQSPTGFDLTGYTMDLTKAGAGNRINYSIQLTFTYVNSTVFTGALSVNPSIVNISFSQLQGYFGQLSYDLPEAGRKDTVQLNIFNNAFGANVSFPDAKLNFEIINSFGVPTTVDLSNRISLYSRYPLPGPTIETFHSPDIDKPIQLASPASLSDNPAITNFGVPLVFNYVPYQILSSGQLAMNPKGPTSIANFVTDQSKIKVRATAVIPMKGKISSNLEFADTIQLSMAELEIDDKNQIEYVKFRTNLKNGFPLVGNFQMLFLDENNNIIDSLRRSSDEEIALPEAVIVNGRVVSPAVKMYETLINREKFLKVKKSTHSIVRARFKTATPGEVKIYSDYFLGVKLSVEAKINYNLNQ